MIEEDVSNLDSRVSKLEEKFDKLTNMLTAGFGSEMSLESKVLGLESLVDYHKGHVETWKKSALENNALLVELARILGVKKITADAMKEAARQAKAKKGGT